MSLSTLAVRLVRMQPRRIHIVAPLFFMALLYWFSSLPGAPLPEDPALYALFDWLPPSVQNALHVPAYAALTLAWYWALRAWLRTPSATVLGACAIASTYGLLDEWHQSYVPGRYASLTDVLLDVAGVALGIWLANWIDSRVRTAQTQTSEDQIDPRT